MYAVESTPSLRRPRRAAGSVLLHGRVGLALMATLARGGRLDASASSGVLGAWLGLHAGIALSPAGLVVAMPLGVRGLRLARA